MTRSKAIGLTAAAAAVALLLAPGTSSAQTDAGTACTPTTRVVDTLTYATAIALSPRGHVVADEADPGAVSTLWLHRPDGSKTTITFGDGSRPEWPSDVSARGLTVGTEGVRFTPIEPVLAWASQGGDAAFLPMPTSLVPNYMAHSVNADGVVAGVTTNYRDSLPGQTDFLARPVVWPSADADPQELPMPTGAFEVAFSNEKPLISIRHDGLVSAILENYDGPGAYLARWRPGAAAPALTELSGIGRPVAVAGRWVVGRPLGDGVTDLGQMYVWSPSSEITLSDPLGRFGVMGVAANGTYFGTITVAGQAGSSYAYSVVGRGTAHPREVGTAGLAVDVAGTADGLLLVDTPTTTSVVSCALSLPAASDVVVTQVVLP